MSRKLFVCAAISVVMTAMVPQISQAQAAETQVTSPAKEGVMLYSAEGRKVGAIYRAFEDGRAGVIVGGKMLVVPGDTLSLDDDKLTTSLTYRELMKLR